jgi:hypothetical protein
MGEPAAVASTRAVLEAVLATPAAAPAEIIAARWEVSIPQASGPPLALQADRARPIHGTDAWTLDIRAGRELQPALARSAPRLSERFEARSLHVHVRIERHREEDE